MSHLSHHHGTRDLIQCFPSCYQVLLLKQSSIENSTELAEAEE
jgi:hypothetical protein